MKRQPKANEWKKYAALCTKKSEDVLDVMRRVNRLHRVIVKRALQKQAQYETPNTTSKIQ